MRVLQCRTSKVILCLLARETIKIDMNGQITKNTIQQDNTTQGITNTKLNCK